MHDVWNMWEIHSLLLLSLFLQVFLFFTAGLRRCSTSLILRTVLWLAYLSADAVAVFVLGHLAVHASEPRHQLMSFWAPFVLVHLGGQDTITAFSKQDNELWMRHLLSLFTQVGVAGYVVAKASWPDKLLRSAMVLMFLSGCIKYAERTMCLYLSNPAMLRSSFLKNLSKTLGALRIRKTSEDALPEEYMMSGFNLMWEGRSDDGPITASGNVRSEEYLDVLFVDVPPNTEQSILAADSLPGLLKEFLSSAGRYRAYDSVGACLAYCYSSLYSKGWLRRGIYEFYTVFLPDFFNKSYSVFTAVVTCLIFSPLLLYPFFQHVSTPIALVLFTVTQKGDKLSTSRADIMVSYILLVGAVVLDVCSITMFLLSIHVPSATCSKKQWSEDIGQYSMIKRHVVEDTTTTMLSSIRQWIGRHLGGWGVALLELTQKTITKPVKEHILDNLLLHGIRKEWHVASSRGLLAVQNWKDGHQDPSSKATAKALEKTISSVADFPTSVLIWHLATDICYYYSGDSTANTTSNNHSVDHLVLKEDKEVSRELSNYIMYIVFKCGVKLTPNSQHVHDKAHDEIRDILSSDLQQQPRQQTSGGEKAAFMKILKGKKKKEEQDHSTSTGIILPKHGEGEPCASDDTAADNHVQKLLQSARAFDSPVLPRACELAQTLTSIDEGQADRWGLIAAVWSEMLYYAATRCGGAFHYEHLSTGGEFATHVLALMRDLGPFMPTPDDQD